MRSDELDLSGEDDLDPDEIDWTTTASSPSKPQVPTAVGGLTAKSRLAWQLQRPKCENGRLHVLTLDVGNASGVE